MKQQTLGDTRHELTRTEASQEAEEREETVLLSCLSRREFLLVGGAGAVTVLLGELFPGRVLAQDERRLGQFAAYPRQKIGKFSRLEQDQPVEFLYPDDGPHSLSFLVKLGREAGGGIGPERDVVAFNTLCTHQGGSLRGFYDSHHKVAGPCPNHLSTFDLTRHGMVISASATQGLPQIVLELEGDEIYAVGILGLMYGYHSNVAFVKGS
ncbi:arsenate reductase (azurin) small subunit [Acidobacteria bacterium AH-259-D05]|nr:arsenate reductase (azurin) small subunit [Acidobacteria bacterium AH-259-D05]